jgi:hypothetical protein
LLSSGNYIEFIYDILIIVLLKCLIELNEFLDVITIKKNNRVIFYLINYNWNTLQSNNQLVISCVQLFFVNGKSCRSKGVWINPFGLSYGCPQKTLPLHRDCGLSAINIRSKSNFVDKFFSRWYMTIFHRDLRKKLIFHYLINKIQTFFYDKLNRVRLTILLYWYFEVRLRLDLYRNTLVIL